jgi:hypothetical protein
MCLRENGIPGSSKVKQKACFNIHITETDKVQILTFGSS